MASCPCFAGNFVTSVTVYHTIATMSNEIDPKKKQNPIFTSNSGNIFVNNPTNLSFLPGNGRPCPTGEVFPGAWERPGRMIVFGAGMWYDIRGRKADCPEAVRNRRRGI